jgi:hypothetical protein
MSGISDFQPGGNGPTQADTQPITTSHGNPATTTIS